MALRRGLGFSGSPGFQGAQIARYRLTETNTAVIKTARERGIPHTLERIAPADLEWLAGQGCELLVCAGYYYRAPVTDAFPMVNFHPTPLPVGRGSWPMPRLILEGAEFGGVTAHKMAAA